MESLEEKIDITLVGSYTEFIIINNTGDDIYKKTQDGSVECIKFHYNATIGTGIHIIIRSTQAERYENSELFGSVKDKAIPTVRYHIPDSDLNKGSYYHKETNILFTNKAIGGSMPHPLQQMTYKEMWKELERVYFDNNDNTTITININDPSGKLDMIYGDLGGHKFTLNVTHIKSNKDTSATIQVVSSSNGNNMTHYSGEIDTLRDGSEAYIVCDVFDKNLILARSMNNLLDGINEITAKEDRAFDDLVQKHVENKTNETITQLKSELDDAHSTIRKLQSIIKERDSDIKSLKTDLKHTQASLDTIISTTAAAREVEKAKTDRDTNRLKKEEQKHKTNRAKMSTFSEVVKVLTPIITAVAGVAIGLLISNKSDSNDSLFNLI